MVFGLKVKIVRFFEGVAGALALGVTIRIIAEGEDPIMYEAGAALLKPSRILECWFQILGEK
jgi:hypothetical protein